MTKNSNFTKILSGSIWGIFAKILDAFAKFFTIPMLVGFYGKADYGLIALAFSLNAYLRLMDMGMNVGSIRFFSMWIAQKKWDKIGAVSRSSVVFYGIIGIVNALVFVFMAERADLFFNISPSQTVVFKWMMYILSISTVFNWMTSVVSQLLNAYGEQGWVNRVTVVSSVLNFVTALIAVKYKLTLPVYFLLYTLSTLVIIPFNVYRLKIYKMPFSSLLAPKWNGQAFKEILGYSLTIFAIGIFQQSADSLRPLLLGKFASKGIEVLTEYRVIQTITMLIIAFGAIFMQVLLPSASKIYAENDRVKLEKLVYDGTKYISVFLSMVVFILIVNAKIILNLYMGSGYDELSLWLIIWLFTVLISMHNAPVASLVLSTGKTKYLAYFSAFTCVVSLPITALLANKYNVGAAVIGFFVYVCLQIGFYYFYYIPRELFLNGSRIFFKSFMPSVLAGIIGSCAVVAVAYFFKGPTGFISLISNSVVFLIIYSICVVLFVIRKHEIMILKSKIFKN